MNRLALCVSILLAVGAGFSTGAVYAHDELAPQVIKDFESSGTLKERKGRIETLQQFRMSEAIEQRALYKIRRAALEASGLSPIDAAKALTTGPAMAFPYNAEPELRARGTVKTLTVLLDFKDHRAASRFPNLTTNAIRDNIYGAGTAVARTSFKPHESVHEYYRRASQDQVDLQGSVLGWHHFAKDRRQYEPVKAPASLPDKQRRDQQALNDNTAIFKMLSEALTSLDTQHDFSQYDNDGDGDIDLVTILYSGPDTDWGSFWWAYRWEFYTPEATTKKFDGKRVKQFVFQFVETRGPNDNDYNPTTLLHEMGHAFGLADYYDYDRNFGPEGGVGGLDMMHANKGNQNAFSRWLLDWIKPTVIGSGGLAERPLNASGSTRTMDKAIAIFPGLVNSISPSQEMFIVENRHRIGNDAALPSDGLVVWHIDATLNAAGNGFANDNSYTDRKLIRLLRADNAKDFFHGEQATATTYFTQGKVLTPSSSPNSKNYIGHDTHISLDQIGPHGETIDVRIGFLNSAPPGPGLAPLPAQPPAATLPMAPAAAASSPPLQALVRGQVPLDLDTLESLDDTLTTAPVAVFAGYWQMAQLDTDVVEHPETRAAVLKLLAARWASKDGAAAMQAIEQLPSDSPLRTKMLPVAMKSWARNQPSQAFHWYLDEQRKAMREKLGALAAPFTREAFAAQYAVAREQTLKSVQRLQSPAQIAAAVDGILQAGSRLGEKDEVVAGKLYQLPSNVVKARVDVIRGFRAAEIKMQEYPQRAELEGVRAPLPQR